MDMITNYSYKNYMKKNINQDLHKIDLMKKDKNWFMNHRHKNTMF